MTADAVETLEPAPAESAPRSLYKYATWIHVGPGAEECTEVDEENGTCACPDSGHFHAWCRLPNSFQERDIRERALAGKARKIRQFREDGTDANVILEAELEELLTSKDAAEKITDELLGYDWTSDYLTAVQEVRDLDDEGDDAGEGAKLYAHIDDDRLRFAKLQSQPEEERSQDEFNELQTHIAAYETAVSERYKAISEPKRESFLSLPEVDLIGQLRGKRIQFAAHQEFMHHYSIHEWLSCTYRQRDGELHFRDLAHLTASDSDVLAALSETFSDLERTAQESQGN